jgi:hypothetical protein
MLMEETKTMNRLLRTVCLFVLGIAVGLPSGILLVRYEFIEKEKAMGMLAEEALADNFAKFQFTHADAQSARAALLYAVQIHTEMQVSNAKYRGRPEKFDLAWCYAELSVLEESAGNLKLADVYMSEAETIFKSDGTVKDSTLQHLREVLRATQAKPTSNRLADGKPQ